MLDNQLGFALDVALATAERFPKSSLVATQKNETTKRIQASYNNYNEQMRQLGPQMTRMRQRVKHFAKRIVHKIGIR